VGVYTNLCVDAGTGVGVGRDGGGGGEGVCSCVVERRKAFCTGTKAN